MTQSGEKRFILKQNNMRNSFWNRTTWETECLCCTMRGSHVVRTHIACTLESLHDALLQPWNWSFLESLLLLFICHHHHLHFHFHHYHHYHYYYHYYHHHIIFIITVWLQVLQHTGTDVQPPKTPKQTWNTLEFFLKPWTLSSWT